MKLMFLDKNMSNPERVYFLKYLKNMSIYTQQDLSWDRISLDQKNFDAVYCSNPEDLLDIPIKIPYFYNIFSFKKRDLFYNYFCKKYASISGASAVFVDNPIINKFCEWFNLNSYWLEEGVPLSENLFLQGNPFLLDTKKFITPKLHIGFIQNNKANSFFEDIFFAKKANWKFHVLGKETLSNPDITYYEDASLFYSNIHLLILHSESFPNLEVKQAMAKGLALINYSPYYHSKHLFFDKVHYLELDFFDKNTILDMIRYCDSRREKLERIAKSGLSVIKKYYDLKKIVLTKIEIMSHELI